MAANTTPHSHHPAVQTQNALRAMDFAEWWQYRYSQRLAKIGQTIAEVRARVVEDVSRMARRIP